VQQFEIGEEERPVLANGTAKRTDIDVLDELRPRVIDRLGCGDVGLQERRLVKPRQVAVKLVNRRTAVNSGSNTPRQMKKQQPFFQAQVGFHYRRLDWETQQRSYKSDAKSCW
jgi:hypothetical protein